jgi:hypothetical protein
MEQKEPVLKLRPANESATLLTLNPDEGLLTFFVDGKPAMKVAKGGKVTMCGEEGESEATPAIYHALRKCLGVPEE